MTLFDRLTKGASKAADQAKFEADKLRRVNRLTAEANDLANEVKDATAAIGLRVMELRTAGKVQLPELDEMVQRVEELQAQPEAKRAELERLKAEKYPDTEAQQAAAPNAEGAGAMRSAPVAGLTSGARVCPACGKAVAGESRFCPACGQKLS